MPYNSSVSASHEYTILGHSRTNYGRHIGTVAAASAALAVVIAPILLSLFSRFGFLEKIPSVVYWPLTAGLFYVVIHATFDRYIWKLKFPAKLLGLPNISGKWICEGQTFTLGGKVKYEWNGSVTIHQTWEKIKIYLDTGQSSSSSRVATICPENEKGFRLIYSYQNEPKAGEQIGVHIGFCDMVFDQDGLAAQGEYYNVKGRTTIGRMTWTKEI